MLGFSHQTPGSLAPDPGLLAPYPGLPLRAPGLPEWTARNLLRVQGFQHPAPWAGHSTPCTTGVPALETRHPARTQRSPALDTWHLNRRSWRQIRNWVLHTDARDPRPRQAPRHRVWMIGPDQDVPVPGCGTTSMCLSQRRACRGGVKSDFRQTARRVTGLLDT